MRYSGDLEVIPEKKGGRGWRFSLFQEGRTCPGSIEHIYSQQTANLDGKSKSKKIHFITTRTYSPAVSFKCSIVCAKIICALWGKILFLLVVLGYDRMQSVSGTSAQRTED